GCVRCEPAAPTLMLNDHRVVARAPAKLNLILRVGSLRRDGFHPLDSIVTKITLYDSLIFAPRPDDAVTLVCDDPTLPTDEANLVVRAARRLQGLGARGGADIELRKRIPAGAGLGGGSADAAVTLRILNDLWSAGLDGGALAALAAELGSDVPLTLGGGASRMQGRGERLTAATVAPFAAVLVTPPVHASTAAVYAAFDAMGGGPLEAVDPEALARGPASQWSGRLVNDLFAPACRVCPEIADWVSRLEAATGRRTHMTGSGSALFLLADDQTHALSLYDRLDPQARRCARVVTQNPW
ncbi:MAG: 4-(cytidine 5'-diphospho)-2-C-methyl-D-erythritol kinase, partial [Planctomycetes bacterium]|nr:4-(cytidine 5'-diphospho)-2-C-methyl-D-erythritol kinase [Planctomycetota bacterium]